MHHSYTFRPLLGLFVVLLAGCGGGGGGASGPGQLVIATGSPSAGMTGAAYPGYTFAVASGGTAPFTWSETGALPPGLSLDATGGLSGTPVTAGTYSFTVTVTDSSNPQLANSTTVSVTIDDSLIVISTSPLPPAGMFTHPYPGFAFTATGGSPPYTWSVKTGALPAGLTLGPDGSITGTVSLSAHSSTFTVVATDSAQTPQSVPQSFTLTIANPGPPVITLTPVPPPGVNGTVYPGFTFTATGGFLPLTWTVPAGTLPTGLTLGTDGSLTGTPTSANTFNFTVTVTDSATPIPVPASAPFSIVITNPPPPSINTTPPPTGTVGTPYSFQFTAVNGLAPLVWSETPGPQPLPNLSLSLGGLLSGTPSGAGIFLITVNVIDQLKQSAPPVPLTIRVSLARPAGTFTRTLGSMTIARAGHTATLLLSGKVLVAGGPDTSAELYDPGSEMFTATTGSMSIARSGHTATLLADAALANYGKVLIAGGAGTTSTAELYDPTSGMFTATGSMQTMHSGHTATLLNTGQVLVAGGGSASAELYNPASGTFTATGNMTVSRTGHTATLLPGGKVLIAGGGTASAELYDPTSGKFTATGDMSHIRTGHTATLLANGTALTNGKVLIAGPDITAEIFDPASGSFSSVGNLAILYYASVLGSTATLRKDGTVLVAGGQIRPSYSGSSSIANAELFASESEGFTATGSLNTARQGQTATALADGTVLVTGGYTLRFIRLGNRGAEIRTVLSSAELFK
jgi:hypothetical protein